MVAPRWQDLNSNVQAMFDALPTRAANGPGNATRAAMVSRMITATPGNHTTCNIFDPKGASFVSIFFPNYNAAPYTNNVDATLPSLRSQWSGWATAVLCQAMYNLTSDLRPQLLSSKINDAVNSFNTAIQTNAVTLYASVFAAAQPDFAQARAAMHNDALAVTQYLQFVGSDAYVSMRLAEYVNTNWPDPEWELFHHWVKLLALGASTSAIVAAIGELGQAFTQNNLSYPSSVNQSNWPHFVEWLTPSSITWSDIESARGPILAQVCDACGGTYSCMNEENSFEFTANSQPGNSYRHAPGGSCFAASTQVVMGDGTLRAIETVQPGDSVLTPEGPRTVAVVSAPLRSGRTLHSVNQEPFLFTGTHPFTSGGPATGPAVVAVDPARVIQTLPGMASRGVAALAPGASLAGRNGRVVVTAVNDHRPSDPGELLYDVVVLPEGSGPVAYFAGSDDIQVAVYPELPVIDDFPLAAGVVLSVLQGIAPALEPHLDGLNRADAEAWLRLFVARRNSVALPAAVSAMAGPRLAAVAPGGAGGGFSPAALEEAAGLFTDTPASTGPAPRATAAAPGAAADGYNWALGALFDELLAFHGHEIASAVEMGWRVFPPALLAGTPSVAAVSVHSLSVAPGIAVAGPTSISVMFSEAPDAAPGVVSEHRSMPQTPFARTYHSVVYFNLASLDPNGEWKLIFTVTGGLTAIATGFLAFPESLSYARGLAVAHAADGTPVGEVRYDIRYLTGDQAAQDRAGLDTWSPAALQQFSDGLGRGWSAFLLSALDKDPGARPGQSAEAPST